MQERVGECAICKKPIVCEDGFLNGVLLEDGSLRCFPCAEDEEEMGLSQKS